MERILYVVSIECPVIEQKGRGGLEGGVEGRESISGSLWYSAIKLPIKSNRPKKYFWMGLYDMAYASASPDLLAYFVPPVSRHSSNKILATPLISDLNFQLSNAVYARPRINEVIYACY